MGATEVQERQLYDAAALARRWGVSPFTIRRLMHNKSLRSITIAARRMVPLSEVDRAESVGVGNPRTRRSKSGAVPARERQ